MKKQIFLLVLLASQFIAKGQNIPFTIGEPSMFKAVIAQTNQACNIPFKCEYVVDEKNSDWTGVAPKIKASILSSTSMEINHMPEYTECKLVAGIKRLTTYTENSSGESFLTYFGDTVAFKSSFTLQRANPSGQDIAAEFCNSPKYDYEGFTTFCSRFTGKNIAHPQSCMVTTSFPSINAIFNLYYGFERPRYFPVNFQLSIDGHTIAFVLKNISFEALPQTQMPRLDEVEFCKEIDIKEFLLKTPELH